MNIPTFISKNRYSGLGFTAIELVVVILILFILGSLVALTYNGVQSTNRDNQRRADIETLQSQLEIYYAKTDRYPSLPELNDHAWRAQHIPEVQPNIIEDPRWDKSITQCTTNGQVALAAAPAENCYSYQATAPDGAACDNITATCGQYTLTAILESNNESFVKTSLN